MKWENLHNAHLSGTPPGSLQKGFKYLGLQIRIDEGAVTWRVDEDKINKLPREPPHIRSPRGCAFVVGKVLAAFLPSGRPMGSSENMVEVIDCLRFAARSAHTLGSWDAQLSFSEIQRCSLASGWANLLNNPWRVCEKQVFDNELILATDASNWGWGMVVMDMEGNILKQYKQRWNMLDAGRHIFIREVLAAEKGLRFFERLSSFSPTCKIHLVVDNTAAAWAYARGYTVNKVAMESIRSVLHLFTQWNVVTVVSEDNVADKPSRNKVATQWFAERTLSAVRGAQMGRKSGVIIRPVASGDIRMRHIEYDQDDEHENILLQ